MRENLQNILQHIYQEKPDNAILINLLKFLAPALRTLHDQQFRLPQLTNAHIFIEHNAYNQWSNLRVEKMPQAMPASLIERANDLSQLSLPDDYWRIFKHMYFNDATVPTEFSTAVDKLRAQKQPNHHEKNIWLWDEKSAQAMVILNRHSKKRYRSIAALLKQAGHILAALIPVLWRYRQLRKKAFQQPITLTDRIGIALHTDYAEHEIALLNELKNIPVLLRFACHESEAQWQKTIALINLLTDKNIKVSVALLQDRQAVLNPTRWKNFLNTIVPAIHDKVQWLEVGHAINRVKWGIWTAAEYAQLVDMIFTLQKQYPKLQLTGPAVIDFEWHRIIDALKSLPKKIRFSALSHHLYVDRRGAPENYQGKFSTLEKAAMLKAIASTSKHCNNSVIISEVNWPLQDTGIWSPIGSPYTTPEWFRDRPGVTEEDYANYLIRYLAIALCSGFVDQVFWWRLSAHGFGLVDDQNNFKKRPAFFALKTLLEQVGNATFMQRLPSPEQTYLLLFKKNSTQIVLCWSYGAAQEVLLPHDCHQIIERNGRMMLTNEKSIKLTQEPMYCVLVD